MTSELTVLTITAASLGFFHTLFGPDHYIPFIAMARAGKWSLTKTTLITFLCGVGHIASSIVLGLIGIALGIAVTRVTAVESFRGNIAAWALIVFGLIYFVWGLRRALRNKTHEHTHGHVGGHSHTHEHNHHEEHLHVHSKTTSPNLTPWILFTIFVFGPCEPLIPILMYPAATGSFWGVLLVTSAFAVVTIGTMLGVVLVSILGIDLLPMMRIERYSHALAGATIFLCGMMVQFLGL
jgi:nickel/cobalt transporter (NicO) family protein